MSEIAGLILVLLVPLCGLLPAQTVPPLINYQGQLSDAAGNPLPTADYTLTFTIHDAATGGSQVWGPQIFDGLGGQGHGPKIPVVQGFFNVLLGPVDTAGRSLADAFNAPNRWVEIKVGNNAPIAPRQQILSAPFAFRAAFAQEAANAQTAANAQNAQNLEGRPAGTFVAKAGDTMTGRLNLPNDGLTVGGNQLVVANGNVGIGTPAPKAKLDVAGTVKAHKLQLNGGDDWTDQNWTVRLESPLDSAWRSTTTDFDGKYLGLGMTHSGWYFLRSTAADTSAPPEYQMFVRYTGEVGIGTTSPQAKLEVAGTVKASAFQGVGTVPPGCIMAYGGSSLPEGWLWCDGAQVSRTTYASLFAAIGTAWGRGDGSTTFNTPDLRGYFLRGRDAGTGRDPDSASRTAQAPGGNSGDKVGSVQADEFRAHTHPLPLNLVGTQDIATIDNTPGSDESPSSDLVPTGPRGGSETRPKNAYVHYIIKY